MLFRVFISRYDNCFYVTSLFLNLLVAGLLLVNICVTVSLKNTPRNVISSNYVIHIAQSSLLSMFNQCLSDNLLAEEMD
jgi:hypothetical protein